MKKMLAGLLGTLLLISIQAPAISAEPSPTHPIAIAGGYSVAAVTDAAVKEAANFAAKTLSQAKARVKTIHQAESQVVAGMNYRIDMTLSDAKHYHVTVYKALNGDYSLSNSELVPSDVIKPYTDIFAYCAAVKNIDSPDNRYTGEPLPKVLFKALGMGKEASKMALENPGFVSWRCMDKKVWTCSVGANVPCDSKADSSRKPNDGMKTFCKSEPNADFIPAVAAGRTTIYEWRCKSGKPKIVSQATPVDARGYPAVYWTLVKAK